MTKSLLWLALVAAPAFAQDATLLGSFDAGEQWRAMASNQVTGTLRRIAGADGRADGAVCLDYDYNGVSGHASLERDLPLDFPDNYRIDLKLRGEAPANEFQFKFIDASGDNVWWIHRPRYPIPTAWTPLSFKQRHVVRAWGPDSTPKPKRTARIQFTIYNNVGGKGSVCFDDMTLTPLPADDGKPLTASASANAGKHATAVVDADASTHWSAPLDAKDPPQLTLDFGRVREFGGLELDWLADRHAADYTIQLSDDARTWRDARRVAGANGGRDWIALPESEARYVRVQADAGPADSVALVRAQLQPLVFAETPNAFVRSVAQDAPRGTFPRGFHDEQSYWTLLGIDGGREQGLIDEAGAVEVARGGFSLEPFLQVGDRKLDWSTAASMQSLQDGYLPIASVDRSEAGIHLRVTAFAAGTPERSQLVSRYTLRNDGETAQDVLFALALRPLQVNPPTQFLSTPGGVSPIHALEFRGGDAYVDGRLRVQALQAPDATRVATFDGADDFTHRAEPRGAQPTKVDDPTGLASGAYVYRMRLAPGESRRFDFLAPMTGAADDCKAARCDAEALQRATADTWRAKLDQVTITVPPAGQPLADTLRSATAQMLMSRIGPRLQPGTRSYARSWIRDGAMISEGLLRVGRDEVVREYVELFAPFQFRDGMVPCCIDDRGSDPVPENDSHGELIFNIAEYWRYTRETAFLERMWPHVLAAYGYMEKLRLSERTEANRAVDPAYYGMMPVSISHEGYSSKPVHSYWDNFWALRGYKDAVQVADALGKREDAARMRASLQEFRTDLDASLQAAVKRHGIDYLPGAAELGDFDPTSTTIALAPGGEQAALPQALLRNTFEKYWERFVARRDGTIEWKDYTPYEWRNVGAFVRLGWRDRANAAVDGFFADRAPPAWNQWAEVVSRTPRQPFFVGDLPHAWVASDFLRSALDMFAYMRESDDSYVLAAGVPAAWLAGEGIALKGLYTPHGRLSYRLRRDGARLHLSLHDGLRLPAGGLVLPWPYADETPGTTRIGDQLARWKDGELRVIALPAEVVVEIE